MLMHRGRKPISSALLMDFFLCRTSSIISGRFVKPHHFRFMGLTAGVILPPRGRLAMSEKCWVVTAGEGRGARGAALGISGGKARAAAPHPSVRRTALHNESLHGPKCR